MSHISRLSLFSKLNATAFKSVEGATVLCKLRGNPYVELVHWVTQILNQEDSDWHVVLRHFDVDHSQLLSDLQGALERLPRGAQGISDLAEVLPNTVERAWVYASLMFGSASVRTGHVLLALLKTESLQQALYRLSPQFKRVQVDALAEQFEDLLAQSTEAVHTAQPPGHALPGEASGAMPAAQLGQEEALKRYTVDLTEKARNGQLDPVTGRELEVRQVVDILLRRRQNNPLITGEAGVGKTALVEGFALQVAAGQVPPALAQVRVLVLDLGLLQAGASMKGEFEQRLRQVIDEIQASPQPTILFIDEVHTLVGAGGQQGTGDAANLLKPALARGALRTIGATTWAEYKKYIEKDPALTRRFQVVQVAEPDEALGVAMLRGLASAMEQHHQVLVMDEAVQAAVKLSHRYIPARQLPDKAISLLDTACARVAVSQHAQPPGLAQLQAQWDTLQAERDGLKREADLGHNHAGRLLEIESELDGLAVQRENLERQWAAEKEAIAHLLGLRAQRPAGQDTPSNLLQALRDAEAALKAVQGEHPMVHAQVDAQCVAAVVADWTGIPVGRMVRNEIENVLNLAQILSERIVGQDHALETIARRVQTHRAGLDDPNKPVGVFMLAGSSGVGKTETALALADNLYGGEHNLITINMSEYQEAHTVSSLKGSPPGYVGYGEGGVLTEAVRRRPYSVVLLDEIEKAHPDVHELFFQVFDKGWMEDGEGRRIDFRNTLIVLTTNVGTDTLMQLCQGEQSPPVETLCQALHTPLLQVFPPALLGRLEVVPYLPLSRSMLTQIVDLQLQRVQARIAQVHRLTVLVDAAVVQHMVDRCQQADAGGRVVGALLSNTVLPEVSRQLLHATLAGKVYQQLHLRSNGQQFVYEFA
ncbi:MAG TPA: type VI secretion system ATPase TssH [Limnobacter sp.]|nr:type VI secretion system ATPase TssH [Limnobacter sp.]